jgi:Tfp pilus assembly protein PilF
VRSIFPPTQGLVDPPSEGPPAALQKVAYFILLGCMLNAVPAAGQGTVTLMGQVRTEDGQVIPSGVNVRLETGEGAQVGQLPANSDGQFEFDDLRKITYHLTATADGFQPAEKDVDLGYGANRVIVNLLLTPLTKTKQVASALPTLTDMQAPSKARKEYEKGVHALIGNDVSGARARFEGAVAIFPCYARAQTDLALALTMQHESSGAEAALKKALFCDPGYLDAYPQLGQLYNAEKKFAESEAVLQQGLRHSASAWSIYYQLGVAYYGQKEYAKAEEAFLKSQSLNQSPPAELHVKLADVYLKEGAYDKAYEEMQAYLRADPNGRLAAKVKNIMQQMEASGIAKAAAKPPENQPPPAKP